MAGGSCRVEFLAHNSFGQAPSVKCEAGETLAQSDTIIFHLGEASDLVPADRIAHAKILEWMS